MNFEATQRSAGNEAAGKKMDGNKAMRFFRDKKGEVVDASSPEGQKLQEASNREWGQRQEAQQKKQEFETDIEGQNVEATFLRETGMIRDNVQNNLQVQLTALDQSLMQNNQNAIPNFDVKAMMEMQKMNVQRREAILMQMQEANKNFNILAGGVQAWRTGKYPSPEFEPLLGKLVGDAEKQMGQYKNPNDPGYRDAMLRKKGLMYIQDQLKQAQAKARPPSNG